MDNRHYGIDYGYTSSPVIIVKDRHRTKLHGYYDFQIALSAVLHGIAALIVILLAAKVGWWGFGEIVRWAVR